MNRKKKIPDEFEKSTLSYFSDIGNFSPLSRDEELSLWERYKKNNDRFNSGRKLGVDESD